ncbi:hypothetical protein L7F22_013680 [Adiantum nelumboides]|nr:hypothetical protein [Adiantum nelumboides]
MAMKAIVLRKACMTIVGGQQSCVKEQIATKDYHNASPLSGNVHPKGLGEGRQVKAQHINEDHNRKMTRQSNCTEESTSIKGKLPDLNLGWQSADEHLTSNVGPFCEDRYRSGTPKRSERMILEDAATTAEVFVATSSRSGIQPSGKPEKIQKFKGKNDSSSTKGRESEVLGCSPPHSQKDFEYVLSCNEDIEQTAVKVLESNITVDAKSVAEASKLLTPQSCLQQESLVSSGAPTKSQGESTVRT